MKEVESGAWPLFLTQAEWLLMLDATLPRPFFARNADGSVAQGQMRQGGLGEEASMLDAIPGELDDDWLLDTDDDGVADKGFQPHDPRHNHHFLHKDKEGPKRDKPARSDREKGGGARVEVDFRMFSEVMWPRIAAKARNKAATKSLSPSSVFQEIQSYIKGSARSLNSPKGYLDRQEYLHLGAKMAPNFKGLAAGEDLTHVPGDLRGHRDVIYDLFEAYEDEKKNLNGFDVLDLVFHIWTQIHVERKCYSGAVIHSVYIDETQDFTQAELRLIVRLCDNLNDMFFCGDTAQTIASGVAFRFQDLRALFKLEADARAVTLLDSKDARAVTLLDSKDPRTLTLTNARQGGGCNKGSKRADHVRDSINHVRVPNVHALSVNYRTHNGVLGVAACVVDMLSALFPASIDPLPRERGFFSGPKPVLLRERGVEDAVVLIAGAQAAASRIQFGAHQVILVRTQEAKARLPPAFDACLAMTILESKGLEFDDVFIWDFFADSRADTEWRVILNFLKNNGDKKARGEDGAGEGSTGAPHALAAPSGMLRALEFEEREHQILCEELKHLYTAVTRARVRLVFYDSDLRKRAPMFHLLQSSGLVDTLSLFAPDSPADLLGHARDEAGSAGSAQRAQEWREQGITLRDRGLYQLAAKCFLQARDTAAHLEDM